MAPFDLHQAERHALDVVVNIAAGIYVWWRFRRPTIGRRAR